MVIGVVRIVSDDHWASDEIIGGAIGALIGWGVPYALHLHELGAKESSSPMVAPMPMAFERGGGLGLVGFF